MSSTLLKTCEKEFRNFAKQAKAKFESSDILHVYILDHVEILSCHAWKSYEMKRVAISV